jgi:hypothetical protein
MQPTKKDARVAGLLYVLLGVLGPVRLIYIPTKLIVSGNATATANNIAAHEMLFRFGIVSDLVGATIVIFVTLALYRLLKGVDQGLAAVMVILGSLMVTPIYFVNTVNDGAALLFARGADFLFVFDKPQRDAFAMLFLRLHHQCILANEIFWGLWLFPLGLLIYRSRFLPRFLGAWLILACFAYLALSFTGLLLPQYESKMFTLTQPFMLGEVATMLWLLIRGIKEQPLSTATAASCRRPC